MFLPRLEPDSFLIQDDCDKARPACLACLLSECSGVMFLHPPKVKWLSLSTIFIWGFYYSQRIGSVYQGHTHMLGQEAFASNTNWESLFSGVQAFMSSIMASTNRLSSVYSDVINNGRRMPLLSVFQWLMGLRLKNRNGDNSNHLTTFLLLKQRIFL